MSGASRAEGIVALLLLLAAVGLCAQSPPKVPRRLVVAVEQRSDAWSAADALLVSRSLLHAIQGSGAQIRLLDWGPEPFPSDGDERAMESLARRADCWLLLALAGSPQKPMLRVRSRDLITRELPLDQQVDLAGPIDPSDIPADVWKPLVELITAAYPPVEASEPLASAWSERPPMWTRSTVTLSVTAAPGTTIRGLDGDPVTVGESGTAVLEVRSPATYKLVATRDGYLPFQERIYLEADRQVTLPQIRAARFALDAGLYGVSFPSVDGTLFLVPGWLFARAGVMTYLAGLALTDTDVLWSAPLSTVWAHLGTYAFFPQQSLFRAYLAVGAFARVAHPLVTSPPVSLDLLAPWGLQLVVGFEGSPWPASRFFLEWMPTEYVSSYPDLLRASFGGRSVVSTTFGAIDFGAVRLGWRWLW